MAGTTTISGSITEAYHPADDEDNDEDDYQVDAIYPTKKMQRPNKLSIPELLALRQEFGLSSLSLPPFARPRALLTSTLSSKIAWNSNRLQNMILTVGPGTPATVVDLKSGPSTPTNGTRAADSTSESSSNNSSDGSSGDEEEEGDVAAALPVERPRPQTESSSAGSSVSTTNPKRTLSDRMKDTEEEDDESSEGPKPPPCQLKHDINLEATTSEDDDDESGVKQAGKSEEASMDDEEMAGYCDVDKADDEETEELAAHERFYLEVNPAEDHRMQFSSNGEEQDDESDSEEDAAQQQSGRRQFQLTESTDEDESEDDEQELAEWMVAEQAAAAEGEVDDSESYDSDESDDEAARIIVRRRFIQRSPSPIRRRNNEQQEMKASMRHAGCINTATWLDAGWRLSTVSSHHYSTSYNANFHDGGDDDVFNIRALATDDCPTQLLTSGDDRQVKFWDVRHSMGSSNPLSGGRNTHCPFASTEENQDGIGYKARWKNFYHHQHPVEPWKVSGNIVPLATLGTGHRANVFHVTPLWQQPGKVATCGADGYLRLGDVEASSNGDSNSSSIVISPEYGDTDLFRLGPGICFSHHFLNSNVGLLCSERGLRKFDIRLPPRQQEKRALIGGSTTVKACAIWTESASTSVEELESSYVFVGGTGAEVALCDLRMTGGGSSSSGNPRVVCSYRPKNLDGNEEVSVSGLDLSKDKRELLVSYESDQIYTFPIFPNTKSAAGPSLDEIGGLEDAMESDDNGGAATRVNGASKQPGDEIFQNELAAYGGHLNRFTFLKNARYAGPNDEYICTGSDSGHAWIYERSSGAVVSLLNADNSTCNGIVPHPSLPFFITYGIDSTAKFWRATGPVDPTTDDSPRGRVKAYHDSRYEISPLAKDWNTIEREITNMEQELAEADEARKGGDGDDDDTDGTEDSQVSPFQPYSIFPDQVLSRKELINSGSLGRSILCGGSRLGNDLHRLPVVLNRNQYECVRGALGGRVGRHIDMPVESDIKELMRRVSSIRLRHQADQLGIGGRFNPNLPWMLDATNSSIDSMVVEGEDAATVHPADLVPDYPSDWIPYDPEMAPNPRACGASFNCDDYGVFYRERYLRSDCSGEHHQMDGDGGKRMAAETAWRRELQKGDNAASANAYTILHETARVLKDGGNEALREGQLDTAAKRYDKAIRYCSVAFMSSTAATTYGGKFEEELMSIYMKLIDLDIDETVAPLLLKWSPLLKVLISTRLNLSMVLLKKAKHSQEVPQLDQAMEQAKHALRELRPFCTQKGKICATYETIGGETRLCPLPPNASSGSKSSNAIGTKGSDKKIKIAILKANEPDNTYKEAKTLEAKAYFRLGSSEADRGEASEAILSFEKSMECTLELNPDAKLDALVVRRLAEAKREKSRQTKRQRKKFRFMFAPEEEDGRGAANDKKKKDKGKTTATNAQKETTRRRTSALPMVSPPNPGSVARTSSEDRGTQSE